MKIEIIEKGASLIVRVAINRRKYARDPNIHVDTSNIRDYLSENNVDFGICVKDNVLTNYTGSPKLEGEWVFLKPAPVLVPKIVEKTESEEETDEQPKPAKRRRRRRSSSAKDKLLGTENME
tara:strand:- start:83 stop:448 length:366 start_codon:yes stop_codon:yes gene_type:complete